MAEKKAVSFSLNGEKTLVTEDGEMPLLWVIRDKLEKTGTKFGCGIGYCGACTVHIDGIATRSCVTPIELVEGAQVTTIEGLAKGQDLTQVQAAWIAQQVPQCGYCQAGQIMSAAALLKDNPDPTDAE